MTSIPLLVVGEVLVDILPSPNPLAGAPVRGQGAMTLEGRFGGSPANVAVGLARLAVPVRFAGRLSRHGYGPWLRARLASEGIDLDASVDATEPCTLAVVTLDEDGSATYEFYGPTSADWAWHDGELPEPASLTGTAVHTGSLATALAPGAGVVVEWLRRLREGGGVAVSYDPNIRPSLLQVGDLLREVVEPALACAHLVKVSEEDLGALRPGIPVEEMARSWLASGADDPTGPQLVVVTGGPTGASAWHRDGRHVHVPAPGVDVVDTVGAGDAFSAGLLSALSTSGVLTPQGLATIDDAALTDALRRGALVASVTCARPGADPPRLEDLPD